MRRAVKQLALRLKPRFSWGGARAGAGRKPGVRPLVLHRAREELNSRHPVHITLRVERAVENLREKRRFRAVREAIRAGRERFGFRLVHFSVQGDHLHLIAEVENASALSRGVKGLQVRIARKLNALANRSGAVFRGRYHARALKTPTEVRNGLAYVLLNAHKHAEKRGQRAIPNHFDVCSSAMYFDGWKHRNTTKPTEPSPAADARTWLLRLGWRKLGLIALPRSS